MKQRIYKAFLFLLCAATLCHLLPSPTAFAADSPAYVTRLAGNHRLTTAFLIADQMKELQGTAQFDSVIVASGATFADALPGSYLAAQKQAPILLTMASKSYENQTKAYLKTVLKPGGTVYILGGANAVPTSFEAGLDGYTIRRVAGANRILTNLAILNEAKVEGNTEFLVCTSENYADSLSASATGKPILLVKSRLSSEQKAYLATLSGISFCIVGGENAVPNSILSDLSAYGPVTRLAGKTRQETSILVAERYFPHAASAVVAYGWNFPDGLCGGPLAYAMNAPLLLTSSASSKYQYTASYTNPAGIQTGYVLGGAGLVSDTAAQAIFAGSPIRTTTHVDGYVTLSRYEAALKTGESFTFDIQANVSGGAVQVASSDETVATASISGNVITVAAGQHPGSAEIIVTAAGSGYYSTASAVCKVTVSSQTLEVSANPYTGVYDGQPHSISVSAPGAAIRYALSEEGPYTDTNPSFTDAGSYTVYYKAEQDGYDTVTGSRTVTISKAPGSLSLSQNSVELDYGQQFDLSVDFPGDGELSVVSSDPAVAEVTLSAGKITVTAKQEGSATLTVSAHEGTNHLAASESVAVTVAYSKLFVSSEGYRGIYDGAGHSISVTSNGGSITYSESENGTYSEANPSYQDAGTYTVFYKVEKDGHEPIFGSEEIIIEKAEGVCAFPAEGIDLGFDGVFLFDLQPVSDGSISVFSSDPSVASVSLSGSVVTVTAKDEGEALIMVFQDEGTNHSAYSSDWLTVTVRFDSSILTVGKDKQYGTIQEAVDAAQDGNVILVYPGTYKEAVDATAKTVTIQGMDKTTCILTYPNGNYYYPPLEMGSGTLKNLTVKATAQVKQEGAVAKAYSLHIDYDILEGKTFHIENVDFINADYQVLGIGLRANSTLEFVDCTFTCSGDSNAFFCHDHVKAAENQRLIVRDCVFVNSGNSYTIQLQAIEKAGSSIYATWENNTVTNRRNAAKLINMLLPSTSQGGGNWLGSSLWTLTPDSMGNDLAALNYE